MEDQRRRNTGRALRLLAASAFFGGAFCAFGDDAGVARSLRHSGKIMSLEHFIQRARRIHPGTLIDAGLRYEGEHHGYVYEIFLLDNRGEVWEIEFDAETGELIERERKEP